MLSYRLLKNHTGILLVGHYTPLRAVHEVVHDVVDRSPFIGDEDSPLLGLAYDVRKAYEQMRETLDAPEHYPEIGPRYGVEILWPVLLVQLRVLRAALGYMDHPKGHQAVIYALEDLAEYAIKKDFGQHAEEVIARWHGLEPNPERLFNLLETRGAVFCAWTKAERKRRFAALLQSFDPMYELIYKNTSVLSNNPDLVPPEEFAKWEGLEWPDPRL